MMHILSFSNSREEGVSLALLIPREQAIVFPIQKLFHGTCAMFSDCVIVNYVSLFLIVSS